MSDVYTMAQLKAGEGMFTSGEPAMIYEVGEDEYITMSKSERPMNPNADFVGSVRRQSDGRPLFKWC